MKGKITNIKDWSKASPEERSEAVQKALDAIDNMPDASIGPAADAFCKQHGAVLAEANDAFLHYRHQAEWLQEVIFPRLRKAIKDLSEAGIVLRRATITKDPQEAKRLVRQGVENMMKAKEEMEKDEKDKVPSDK